MMKKFAILFAVVGFSFSAIAAEYAYPETYKVSYTLDTFLGAGDRVYYNCDAVESKTKSLLKTLGAEKVRVSCSGGFDEFSRHAGPAYVTARFIAPTYTKNNATPRLASVKEVRLRGNDDCHFMTNTLDALADTLELDIVSGPNSCWSSRSSSRFVVSVLAFDE